MSSTLLRQGIAAVGLVVLFAPLASAQSVTFLDPAGDDHGPGTYVYPTDAVYTRGSFDITAFEVGSKGKNVELSVTIGGRLEDPWRMGVGFATQMVFVFIDTGEGGFTQGLPGLNITFAEDDAWDRVVILSPQAASRVRTEVGEKVPADMQDAVIVPSRTKGSGQIISASVKKDELGEGDPAAWGYQVVMQSNEGFPAGTDLLTRKVNEYEGQHRFGGGTDYDCDPHVVDLLAGDASGEPAEIEAQHEMLAYECAADGSATKPAVVKMVRKAQS